jgi:hypothetical protein
VNIYLSVSLIQLARSTDMVQESNTGANVNLLLPDSRFIIENDGARDRCLASLSLY